MKLNPFDYISKLLSVSDYVDSYIVYIRKINTAHQFEQADMDKILNIQNGYNIHVSRLHSCVCKISSNCSNKTKLLEHLKFALKRINNTFYGKILFTTLPPLSEDNVFDENEDYLALLEYTTMLLNTKSSFDNIVDLSVYLGGTPVTSETQNENETQQTNTTTTEYSTCECEPTHSAENIFKGYVPQRRTPRTSKPHEQYAKPLPSEPITSISDIQRLKEYFKNGRNKLICLRNSALFIMGVSTGLRCVDLTSLGIEDVMDKNGNILDEISCCESKTHKMNHPKLNNEVKAILKEYISARKAKYPDTSDDEILFASQNDRLNLDSHSVYHIMRKAQKDLNLPYHLGAHSLRKTFAYWTIRQHYYDQNIMFSLQEMLNHDSLKTTLHYSGHTKEHLAKMYGDMASVVNGTAVPAKIISPEEKKIDKILSIISKIEGEINTATE